MPVTAPMTSAEIIKEQLEEVGIKVVYELYDHTTVSGMILEGDFDLITEWTRYGPSPNDGYFACWHTGGRYNKGRFRFDNAEYDAIIENALTLTDFEERKAAFWAAQEILAEEVAEIPIVFEQKNQIAYSQWHGMNAHPDGWGVNGNWWGNRAVWDNTN
jgi:ABC-type transport system substrate-binding protein